jgi:hypothetical protein
MQPQWRARVRRVSTAASTKASSGSMSAPRDPTGSSGWHDRGRLDLLQHGLGRALGNPQIARRLHCQPGGRTTSMVDTQPALQTQRHFGRNRRPAVQNPRQCSPRHAELRGSLNQRKPQSRKRVVTRRFTGVRGLCILLTSHPSVVVAAIHQHRIGAFESKGQAPISAHPDRPVACELVLEWVKSPAGQRHVLRGHGGMKSRELPPQPDCLGRLNTPLAAGPEQRSEALVRKRSIHGTSE